MKGIFLLICMLTTTTLLATTPNINGTYHCKSTDPFLKTQYAGEVSFLKTDEVYSVTMKYETGEDAIGTGMLVNHGSGIVVVTSDKTDATNLGTEYLTINDDGKNLAGHWITLSKTKVGSETCIREE